MTSGLFRFGEGWLMLPAVESPPIAEWLPERYRTVLDRVADLEAAGRHSVADGIRRDAIRAYSRSWTEKTARRLDSLAERAERALSSSATAARGRAGIRFVRATSSGTVSLPVGSAAPGGAPQ